MEDVARGGGALDQYAGFAETWRAVESLPFRKFAEYPTLIAALGSVAGAKVLDMGCGTGVYCRLLAERGAASVVGFDASADMIAYARECAPSDLPIRYLVGELGRVGHLGEFSVVTAGFLLNHARTLGELDGMCESIARHLEPGGRFVGTLPSSDHDPGRGLGSQYGVSLSRTRETEEGQAYAVTFHAGEGFSVEDYFWRRETYEAALRRAGLRGVSFRPWLPDSEGIAQLGEEYWAPWVENPFAVVAVAVKPR
jgi:SAM-dependent methyltransferase